MANESTYNRVTQSPNIFIDQTLLKPEAAENEVRAFLESATKYSFYSIFLNPCWVELARKSMPPGTRIGSVVGFSLGASTMKAKSYAADELARSGCSEIDMVINVGRLKSGDLKYVGRDIKGVVGAAGGRVVKVIIEACLLTEGEKVSACRIIMESGARFVKTSTGFSKGGATVEDVRLIRSVVGPDFGVKASGGIRDYPSVLKLLQAGANRIGTSAGVEIMEEYKKRCAG
jgi:deoxyribose-phosphate aldolase